MTFRLEIPLIGSETLPFALEPGSRLFVVGPNGSGKSALIQHAVTSVGSQNVRRISAHRQTWMSSGTINMTPKSRHEFEEHQTGRGSSPRNRYMEHNSEGNISSIMFDLVAKGNEQARRIEALAREKKYVEIERIVDEEPGVFDQINELLNLANLAITIENSEGESLLARRRETNEQYDIAQMSDGERNAVILAANILTVKPGTVLLIDEPERHLHRSIVEPLLSALFKQRQDCPFIVSTHDISLPMANPEASVLVIRSCQWNGAIASAWDANLIDKDVNLPEDIKRAILGSRRKILFVEGQSQSLDMRMYSTLFPEISTITVGSCNDVIKAVQGLRDASELHDVEAFGLIDGDNRSTEDREQLAEKGIYALNEYSVESIYYCSEAMCAVARRQAESLGRNPDQMIEDAKSNALKELRNPDIIRRMAARRCEQKAREELQSYMPDWKDIENNPNYTISLSLDVGKWHQEEMAHYNQLLDAKNLDQIIARYPVRESNVLDTIAAAFELTKKTYPDTLIARVRNDAGLAANMRQRIEPVADALTDNPKGGTP